MSIIKDTKLIKKLIREDDGKRYDWEEIKKELLSKTKLKKLKVTNRTMRKSKKHLQSI